MCPEREIESEKKKMFYFHKCSSVWGGFLVIMFSHLPDIQARIF